MDLKHVLMWKNCVYTWDETENGIHKLEKLEHINSDVLVVLMSGNLFHSQRLPITDEILTFDYSSDAH